MIDLGNRLCRVTEASVATSNRPFTGYTRLKTIFSNCPARWETVRVKDFVHLSKTNHGFFSLVLDAHPMEQRNFLLALYDEMMPDAAAVITFDTLVKRHRLLDVIDKSDAARERVCLVYAGVMAGIKYGSLPTEKTGWATGKDNS